MHFVEVKLSLFFLRVCSVRQERGGCYRAASGGGANASRQEHGDLRGQTDEEFVPQSYLN